MCFDYEIIFLLFLQNAKYKLYKIHINHIKEDNIFLDGTTSGSRISYILPDGWIRIRHKIKFKLLKPKKNKKRFRRFRKTKIMKNAIKMGIRIKRRNKGNLTLKTNSN